MLKHPPILLKRFSWAIFAVFNVFINCCKNSSIIKTQKRASQLTTRSLNAIDSLNEIPDDLKCTEQYELDHDHTLSFKQKSPMQDKELSEYIYICICIYSSLFLHVTNNNIHDVQATIYFCNSKFLRNSSFKGAPTEHRHERGRRVWPTTKSTSQPKRMC